MTHCPGKTRTGICTHKSLWRLLRYLMPTVKTQPEQPDD